MTDINLNRFTLQQYLDAMRHHKPAALTVLIGFSIATVCSGALLPFMFARAVELISQHTPLTPTSSLGQTLILTAIIVIVGILFNGIGLRGFAWLDSRAQNHLRSLILTRLLNESPTFYATTMAGSLTGHVIAYTNSYAIVQEVLFQRGLNLFLPLFVSTIIVAIQSPILALLFLIVAALISIKTLTDSRRRAPYRRARKVATTRLNGYIGDVISGYAIIRAFSGQAYEKRQLGNRQRAWQQASQTNLWIFGTHYISLAASVNLLQVCCVAVAAYLASTGSIGLGLVVFAIAYFQRLGNGLLELAPLIQSYQGALMDAAPISELLASRQTLIDRPRARRLAIDKGAISFSNITYRYDKQRPAIFNALSLTIPASQSVGLVGRSGGGKTTLTQLLLRSFDIEQGSITIDGQDIRYVTQHSLRKAIAYVPQDAHLFHRSLYENIAYGKPGATKKEVIAAAKKAHIWSFIQSLPEGLETTVGERGVKLSGGQRQRIAIARAILKDAPILIFDEATSALDSESEQYVQGALTELMKGRTSIVIAHRLSTIQKMDRIVVLDQGDIIQDGDHSTLRKQNGLYATLWQHQTGGFIE